MLVAKQSFCHVILNVAIVEFEVESALFSKCYFGVDDNRISED